MLGLSSRLYSVKHVLDKLIKSSRGQSTIYFTLSKEVCHADVLASLKWTSLGGLLALLSRSTFTPLGWLLPWLRKEELDVSRTRPVSRHFGAFGRRGPIAASSQARNRLKSGNYLALLVFPLNMRHTDPQPLQEGFKSVDIGRVLVPELLDDGSQWTFLVASYIFDLRID